MFDQDKDAFDSEEVRKARELKEKNENDRRPDGSCGIVCRICGRAQGATAIHGSCCYYCHQTL